jgi:nucleoside-diphosphate-sugar epimerase
MSNKLVLVTGAAGGQQGKTGRHVSEMLLARRVPVRAFVHKIDESPRLSRNSCARSKAPLTDSVSSPQRQPDRAGARPTKILGFTEPGIGMANWAIVHQ